MSVRRPLTLSYMYVIVVLLYLWMVTHMYQENAHVYKNQPKRYRELIS